MTKATITIDTNQMDSQELQQTLEDMIEYWFDWATDKQVKTTVEVQV